VGVIEQVLDDARVRVVEELEQAVARCCPGGAAALAEGQLTVAVARVDRDLPV
jgi:hypothetical protein